MDNLAAFVSARLDEDEAAAKAVRPDQDYADSAHQERWSPARALREVAFKRAILGEHRTAAGWSSGNWPLSLRLLAAVWSDHPDYRPEWR